MHNASLTAFNVAPQLLQRHQRPVLVLVQQANSRQRRRRRSPRGGGARSFGQPGTAQAFDPARGMIEIPVGRHHFVNVRQPQAEVDGLQSAAQVCCLCRAAGHGCRSGVDAKAQRTVWHLLQDPVGPPVGLLVAAGEIVCIGQAGRHAIEAWVGQAQSHGALQPSTAESGWSRNSASSWPASGASANWSSAPVRGLCASQRRQDHPPPATP